MHNKKSSSKKGKKYQNPEQVINSCLEMAHEITHKILRGKLDLKILLEYDYSNFMKKMDKAIKAFNSSQPSPITCKKKCDACCYFMVASSPFESAYIWYNMEKKLSLEQINNIKELVNKSYLAEQNISSRFPNDPRRQAREYHNLKIPCPFLSDERLCKIYNYRPLICRFHHAISPPSFCYEPFNNHLVKIWQNDEFMRSTVLFQQFLSKCFFNTDQMGSIYFQLIPFFKQAAIY